MTPHIRPSTGKNPDQTSHFLRRCQKWVELMGRVGAVRLSSRAVVSTVSSTSTVVTSLPLLLFPTPLHLLYPTPSHRPIPLIS